MNIIKAAKKHTEKVALLTRGTQYKYGELLSTARELSLRLQDFLQQPKAKRIAGDFGPRVGILYPPGQEYITATWATWMIGGIAVPLSPSHTPPELAHVLCDSGTSMVLSSHDHKNQLRDGLKQSGSDLWVPDFQGIQGSASIGVPYNEDADSSEKGSLLLYTSGTTGKPKGVLHSDRSILGQVMGMTEAWGWKSNDLLLHALPLHHTHGIINAVYTPQFNGACIDMLPSFSPQNVWEKIKGGSVSVFMGVPTMYSHLLSALDRMCATDQEAARQAASKLRLFVCGSSACPVPIMKQWEDATGHVLLERYGMTEIGMALSNPLQGERRMGSVGLPMPGVSVKLSGPPPFSQPSELLVKGSSLFTEYWNNKKATEAAFDEDGWFKTGDTGCMDGQPPYYRILGRSSVDIIKSGGYKLSALEIESCILESPHVQECVVIGVPDDTYGESVAAIVVPKPSIEVEGEKYIKDFCEGRLAKYKIPKHVWLVSSIKRNTTGKVNKVELTKTFLDEFVPKG